MKISIKNLRFKIMAKLIYLHIFFIFANFTATFASEECKYKPPDFPDYISIKKTDFKSWNEEIVAPGLWVATPETVAEITTLANWAVAHNYKIRAKGSGFSWSPVTVTNYENCEKVLLIDMTTNFDSISIAEPNPSRKTSLPAIKVQTGATMNALFDFLENVNKSLIHSPVVGDITVGGAFSMGNHGFGAPAFGERLSPGMTFGSLSNAIISLTAIVWDDSLKSFVEKEFSRSHPETKAFLVHLGRTLVVEYVISVGENYSMRCVANTKLKATDIFNSFGSYGLPIYSDYLEATGRLQTIYFPFASKVFLRVCSANVGPAQESLQIVQPYNYPYLDSVPDVVSDLIVKFSTTTNQKLTPAFQEISLASISAGIASTKTGDLWGPSKNHLLFIKSTSLKVSTSGYVVITSRINVQNVIHEFFKFYQKLLKSYAAQNEYPMVGPTEIRVTGLDYPEDVLVEGAEAPSIAPSAPIAHKPHLNTAVWIDLTTLPNTPKAFECLEIVEEFLFSHLSGNDAVVRPEWSKKFAFTKDGPWTNTTILKTIIPTLYKDFKGTTSVYDLYDPYHIFSNDFLEDFLS